MSNPTAAPSFRTLESAKVIKRADAYKVRYSDLVIDPTFNKRKPGPRLQAHIQALFEFIMGGGKVPDLEVHPTDDMKLEVVDGHCRHAAIGLAINAENPPPHLFDKAGEVWISVKNFEGTPAQRKARQQTSNEGLKLDPLEAAALYKDMRDVDGLGPEDIAKEVRKTRQHVDQMLHLADAPAEVQQMVADGKVSATEAIKIARKHGADATEVLGQAAGQAAGKVTAKQLAPWKPPAKLVAPMVGTVTGLAGAITNETRETLLEIERQGKLDAKQVTVKLPAAVLFQLLDQAFEIEEAQKATAEKAQAKAKNATQGDLAAGAE